MSAGGGKTCRMASDPFLDRLEGQGLNLLAESRGDLVFASDRPTLEALRTVIFTQPDLLLDCEAALPAVGLAAAYLLVLGRVARVSTRVLTHDAKAVLAEEGIAVSATSTAKSLPERYAAAAAEYERRALAAITPQAFLEELKRIRDR